jgi:hypothetical protein
MHARPAATATPRKNAAAKADAGQIRDDPHGDQSGDETEHAQDDGDGEALGSGWFRVDRP